jgi:hypothetical protein
MTKKKVKMLKKQKRVKKSRRTNAFLGSPAS